MAVLRKRSTAEGSRWYADFYEVTATGEKRRKVVCTGTSCKQTAKEIAKKLEAEAAVRVHRLVDPLEDEIRKQAKRTIEEHLTDFKNKLMGSGNTENHVTRTMNYIREFVSFGKLASISGFNADVVSRWVVSLRDSGMAARTIQARLTALKGFTKWLANGDKLMRDPLAGVAKPNPHSDRRRQRRMLLPGEWHWLVSATLASDTRFGMSGVERSLLYRLAIQTGLRANEIRSLGRGHFSLDGDRPFVRVVSGSTKNRKTAYQYIDRSLAVDLQEHLSRKLPKAPAFSLPTEFEMADMLREDLADARVAWLTEVQNDPEERAKRALSDFLLPENESGQALDFHALRHTCGAWLAIRGVQAKVIQSVMRHSTIVLTLDRYGHLIEGAEAAAIASTSDMTAVGEVLAATGTEGSKKQPRSCYQVVTKPDALKRIDDASRCDETQALAVPSVSKNDRVAYKGMLPSATACETLLQSAGTLGAVAQWLELGTHNP